MDCCVVYIKLLLFLTVISFSSAKKFFEVNEIQRNNPVPIVLWHGMGDSCCNPMSIGGVQKFFEDNIPGVHVHSLEIGKNELTDIENSYLMNVNEQISLACAKISSDAALKDGYNAIGFSQGGQFLRAVAQRCPNPPMKNLITFGGQHQGVFGLPHCPGESVKFCEVIRRMLDFGAYTDYVQSHLVQAQYWHNPLNEEEYKTKSLFLAEINNEVIRNETYKTNLKKLENFVMVLFTEDKMVYPKESEWFGFYKPGQDKGIITLQDSPLYTEDRLGLKEMDEQKKLHFLQLVGDHLQIDLNWLKTNIIDKFLYPK